MSNDDNDGDKPPKRPSKYANRPYPIGKGKTPLKTRFKKGAPSPNPRGRPRGAKNKSSFEKMIDKLVTIGRDDHGRPIRRPFRDIIDHQLLKKAAEGDMRAIKIVTDLRHKYETLRLHDAPDAETVRREIAKEAERVKIVSHIGRWLDRVAQLKKAGIVTIERDGTIKTAPWVAEEAARRKSTARKPGPTS